MRKHKKLLAALLIIVCVIAAGVGGVMLYASDAYMADDAARAALLSTQNVIVQDTADGYAFLPAQAEAGFIFYPGGKVEAAAYAPLMHALADRGVLCVLVEMPLNLAVLDVNAADGVAQQYPQVSRWYIGGHSLGGAMAASYAADHAEGLQGVALLAAYATRPLPDSLAVVTLCGTADQVLDWQKYHANRVNLPQDALEIEIPGGNHAQFGSYGHQEGDGMAAITPQEQLNVAVDALLELMLVAEEPE